jgi:hypothetical protein
MRLSFNPYDPAIWLITSLSVAIVATNVTWLAFRPIRKRGSKQAAPLESILAALAWLLVSLFFLLPPPAAWRFGALSPRLMGLTGIDWVAGLGDGAPLACLIIGLLIFGWLVYRHTLPGDRSRTRAERVGATLRAPVDAALLQWHWAFYRALTIALLPIMAGVLESNEFLLPLGRQLAAAPLYWGSWLGLALIALEWALNPFARAELHRPGRQEIALLRVALAIATTALFTLTPNFWLLLFCHLAVETVIAGWLPLPK